MSDRRRDDASSSEIDALVASTAELFATLTGLDAEQLNRRPAPDQWSAWDIAYHVAQIEVWYFAKLCEAASGDAPGAMRRFVDAWRQLRVSGIELARAIPQGRIDTAGILSGVPDWTPRALLQAIAAHDREHADQARAAADGDG